MFSRKMIKNNQLSIGLNMFRPASLFIGLRYTRAKKRNHFISFISLMSMLGIALGVLVLITVLSVMNGFDREIQRQIFAMVPPITVTSEFFQVSDWQQAEKRLLQMKDVQAVAPFVTGQVLLSHDGVVQPAIVNGILPQAEKKISQLEKSMVQGQLTQLAAGKYGIILGAALADKLGATLLDKIMVITPRASFSPAGMLPRFRRFTVVGIFQAGDGFGFDSGLGFMHLTDAQKLFQLGTSVSGIHVQVPNMWSAPTIARTLSHYLGPTARVSNWTDQLGDIFHVVGLEKTMMFFILLLIVIVAIFNLVCTLVMVVNDKEADIAILRTLGATPHHIQEIFIVQGAIIGLVGTLLGVVSGVALSLHVTQVVDFIGGIFHVTFLTPSAYFGLSHLPSELQWGDVLRISSLTIVLSLLATLYPAFRASRVEPAEALRYE